MKYGLYFFAGLWMFGLGVMVGRGNFPVTFDTRAFQERLGVIAREYTNQVEIEPKVDLGFYDALNNPVRHEVKGRVKPSGEILPRPEPLEQVQIKTASGLDDVPVKLGKKFESLNRQSAAEFKKKAVPPVSRVKSQVVSMPAAEKDYPEKVVSKEKKPLKAKKNRPLVSPLEKNGRYTIQVAAYKAFKDAVSQMADLEKKGIAAYRIKGVKDGVTWYRVRTGRFPDYQAAAARLRELKQAKVNGMIIKKE